MLLDGFTCHYWTYLTVSPCVTETYHLTLQDSNRAVQYATTNCLICDWSQSTWQISQFDDIKRSADRYLANNWQIKWALPARQNIASWFTSFPIHNIPEFFRKLTYFLRSFLNTVFCSKRKCWFFFLSVLLNLLTAINQKTYSILVY